MPPSPRPTGTVALRLPADPAFLSVLRTTAASLAARLDLTLDEVEDLRIAVDEAAALVLGDGRPGADPGPAHLEAVFDLTPARLTAVVSGPATSLPASGEVAWAVLEALVGQVEVLPVPHGSAVRLVHDLPDEAA
ncbi:ATP-binding protein [Pseudokineococcus sp. 1T1Z-3]|uniref:ATP-binding protein n=1 Tax=Pseudokineococcus sp. 1T1Z-3 TaxID=3132745 RepID=UPI00309C75E9